MRINHNIASLNSYRQLSANNAQSGKSLEKLSSGLRINKAGDDAAGLAISEKMRAQIKGLEQATRNAQDGISLIQTAEGALNETHSILQRMRELGVQAANDTLTADDRSAITTEIGQLNQEIDRIANTTKFNGKNLLDGSFGLGVNTTSTTLWGGFTATAATTITVDVSGAKVTATYDLSASSVSMKLTDSLTNVVILNQGVTSGFSGTLDFGSMGVKITINNLTAAGSATFDADVIVTNSNTQALFKIGSNGNVANEDLGVTISSMKSTDLSIDTIKVDTHANSLAAIDSIDSAITSVNDARSKLGAYQNRLEHTINNLGASQENLTASESRIRDVDMAKEMMEFTKNNILTQAATAMLAQANQQPQGVLQLLR